MTQCLSLVQKQAWRAYACVALCMCIAFCGTSSAIAQVEPFSRVIAPANAGLTIQSSGSTLTVTLTNPSALNASTLKSQLGSKAKSISASPDGKRYTVTLSKPYRVRQFVSSKGLGFDVMEEIGPSVLPATMPEPSTPEEKTEAPKPSAPTRKEVEKTAEQKSRKVPTSAQAPDVTVKPTPPANPIPTTKRDTSKAVASPLPEPKPSKATAKKEESIPTPSEEAADTNTIIEEKPTAPADVKEVTTAQPTTKAKEEPTEAEEQPVVAPTEEKKTPPAKMASKPSPAMSMTALPLPKEALEPENKTTVAANANQAVTDPQAAKNPSQPTITEPPRQTVDLLVGVAPKGKGVDITFPWESRVAAALYQRDRDWWLIFAAPARIDMQQFRSVLPNNISVLEPYALSGHTVLHFVTDGKSSLSASQESGSYAWNISIEPGHTSAPKAYALEPMPDAPKPYVTVRAFDVASPISFTDPKYKDRLMVIPSYEANKALITPYQNPDFRTVIANQGIVLHIDNESVTATKGRDGIRLSTPKGLHLSRDIPALPMESAAEAETIPNIMFPYARWRTTPDTFASTRIERTQALANASKENKPKALLDLATLYLGQGMSEEALSLINQLRDRFPEYYNTNEVALLRAAANFMIFRMGDAATDIMAPEIANNPETVLWKDAISLFVPQILVPPSPETEEAPTEKNDEDAAAPTLAAPEPRFDYLAYNRNFIRYYPAQMRQKLAIIAADNFVAQKEYSKAARTMDILNRDGLLMPIRHYAEFLLGRIAADSGKPAEAIKLWKPLSTQYDDMFIHARANFSLATLEYSEGKRSIEDTIKTLERLRVVWRGDTLEQNLLSYLGQLYFEKGDYASALRTWKDYVLEYGASPDGLSISNKMSELFERLYGEEALADTMDPLRSLALFYEFRELSPIGARGDAIIQKLADRLAKFDLLDKAADLLEHQVKFRVQGEERASIGAQLALVHLLNKKPEKALEALEISGYGVASPALASERNRLAALALSKLDKSDISLEMLASDRSPQGQLLRLEILWDEQDWANVINVAEDMLSARTNIASPLTPQETDTLLKLALAYSFESDLTQLKYLREYYAPLMKQSPYKDIFEHITNDTAILDPEDFEMVAKQISSTESFMKHFKDKIAEGRLSSALETETKPTAEEEEQSQSERNSQLVPEAQDNNVDTEPAQQSEDEAPDENEPPSTQRAPVEVPPENGNSSEDSQEEPTNAEATPEVTEEN